MMTGSNKMRTTRAGLVLLVCGAALSFGFAGDDSDADEPTHGVDLTKRSDFALKIGNRFQTRFTVDDPESGSTDESFDIPRYKLFFMGHFGDWQFRLQSDLARGSRNSEDLLEDAYVQYSKKSVARLWVGQGRVPFGRQEMTDASRLQFVDRSIASERFAPGRDVGVALKGMNRNRTYNYAVGVYNGDGINKERANNIDQMVVARLVFTPWGYYRLAETDLERPPESKLSIGVSALTNKIGTEDIEETRVNRGAFEVAFKRGGWNAVAEFYTESENTLLGEASDEEDTDGMYLQVGYLWPNKRYEVAGRYSEVLRDTPSTGVTPAVGVTEVGVAFNYYFHGDGFKLQSDLRQIEFDDESGDEETLDRNIFRVQLQLAF